MSTQILSRQYLRDLPEMKRQQRKEQEFKQQLARLFQLISGPLMAAVELGETKYLYDLKPWIDEQRQQNRERFQLQHQQNRERFQQQHQQEMHQQRLLGRTLGISAKEAQFNAQMQAYQQAQAREQAQPAPEGPSEELLAALKEKFPDCAVSFQEDWIETRQGVRELKKGILIDWS